MTRRALVLVFAIAACDQGEPTAESEVAAELRALRAVLVQRAAEPAAARSFDPSQLAAALSPLRDVLTGLGTQQAELQQRQLALTQEMQRWSQLLVDSVGTTRREEGAALTTRLQQLEVQLQEQKARTQQTETLLQNALDRTADRLEEFLQRVEAGGATSPASSPPAPPAPAPKTEPPKSVGETTRPRRAQQTAAWWWAIAAVVAGWCGFRCFRRWQRRPAVAESVPRHELPPSPPERVDDGVQEIWAAAALLGEAVGRLRESTQAPPAPVEPPNPAPPGPAESATPADTELSDFIVLDDELLRPTEDIAVVGEPGGGPKPAATVCHVPTNDPGRAMDQALQFLGADPRVLRRPEPTVRRGRDGLEIQFRAIPGLPPGEQSHLEQSLRDVCR